MPDPYSLILDGRWPHAPEALRRLHAVGRAKGSVRIDRGVHWLCPLMAWLVRLPPASPGAPIELTVTQHDQWQSWRRQMGEATLTTLQSARDGWLVERYRWIECSYDLTLNGEGLHYRKVAAAIVWGPIRFPLPRWLAPRVAARARAVGDSVEFRVEVGVPVVGTVLVYEGSVLPETAA